MQIEERVKDNFTQSELLIAHREKMKLQIKLKKEGEEQVL